MRNILIAISGPSGVGKGTIVKQLLNRGNFALSISCTTRAPREGEVDGREYFFISREQFEKSIREGGLLEYSNHFGNYYGTPKAFVEKMLESHDVILEIEVDGSLQVKKTHPEIILIMILPPDMDALKARLAGRGSESPEKIAERLKRYDYEVSYREVYDYAIINDDLNTAVLEIENIIKREKERNI